MSAVSIPRHFVRPCLGLQYRQCSGLACRASLISPVEAQDLLDKGSHKYIDVRTAEEFAGGRPIGAVNLPVMDRTAEGMVPSKSFIIDAEQALEKNAPLLIGCASGKRSAKACELLADSGFSNLSDVEGGFAQWAAQGLPVES